MGNKCDLEEERLVTKEEGEALASQFGCPYFETSAKEHINVEEAFSQLVREVRQNIPRKTPPVNEETTGDNTQRRSSIDSGETGGGKKKKLCNIL